MILTILIVIFSIIGLLVFHEFGHFIVAKRFGVKVDEFGIGYPPRLFGKKIGETIYSVNLLPFGAFVKIPGADGDEDLSIEKERRYMEKTAWQKSLILLGGVFSFWIVAIILFSIVFATGVPQAISDEEKGPLVNPKIQVLLVVPDSPADKAGIKSGDAIVKFQTPDQGLQSEINTVKEVQAFSEEYKGKEIILTIQRGEQIIETSLVPRISYPKDEGPMGVALVRTADKKFPWWQAPIKGVETTISLTGAVIGSWAEIIGNLFQGEGMPKGVQLMGPIGIGSVLTQAAQVGLNYFLQFIALIAVYLAIFNLLPIPALDGGKLLFLGIEKFKGSPINQKLEQRLTAAVFILFIILMVWVTFKDISRLI